MKKRNILTALLLATVVLAGCGSNGSQAPAYDKTQLEISEYNEAELTGDIQIAIEEGDAAKQEELTLQYTNLTDVDYNYTALQRLEVELEGDWYIVPDAQDFVTMQLFTLPANAQEEDGFRFEGRYEPLPAGSYRILKTFTDPEGGNIVAAAPFTVK